VDADISLDNGKEATEAFVIKPLKETDEQLPNYLWHTSGIHY
jgi:hypothetical protein